MSVGVVGEDRVGGRQSVGFEEGVNEDDAVGRQIFAEIGDEMRVAHDRCQSAPGEEVDDDEVEGVGHRGQRLRGICLDDARLLVRGEVAQFAGEHHHRRVVFDGDERGAREEGMDLGQDTACAEPQHQDARIVGDGLPHSLK